MGSNFHAVPSNWYKGPAFLQKVKCDWSELSSIVSTKEIDPVVSIEPYQQCSLPIILDNCGSDPLETLFKHYSSVYNLGKAIAWLIRLHGHCWKRSEYWGPITVPEIHEGDKLLVKYIQSRCYPNKMTSLKHDGRVTIPSSLSKLYPVLDDGMIVVGGRLKHAPVSLRAKCLINLPFHHILSRLIIAECHNDAHLGTEWVLSKVRCKLWIVVKCNCVTGKRFYARPMTQMMSDLPSERSQPDLALFGYVGVDVFGPFLVKYGNGTNFVGSQSELAPSSLCGLDSDKIIATARRRSVEWSLIHRSPHTTAGCGGVRYALSGML